MTNKIVRADGTTVLQNVKSCIFSEAVNAETNLKFGCVSASRIDVICYGTQANAVQAGEALTYYQVVNGVETLIGTFYAEPVIPSRMTYSFTAYDALAKLDKDYSERLAELRTNFPMTIKALVQDAASVAGVTVATNSWADSDYQVQYFYADGITCRQILSWAAEIAGMFVQCNTSGQAVFRTYTAKSGYKIAPGTGTESGVTKVAYKQNGLTYANYAFDAVDGVNVHPSEEDQIGVLYPANATGNIVNIYSNLLLSDADDADYLRVATRLYNAYQGLDNYRPFEAKLFPSENPFRAGDIVSVTDAQGVSFSGMIYSLRVDSAEAVVSSSGNETFEEQTEQSTKSKITNLGAGLVRLKNLFVENLEALVARIDNLFAQEITMTGMIHSDDYARVQGQPFANGGMALDFVSEEISAPCFAIDEYGNLYSKSAYLGNFHFVDSMESPSSNKNLLPTYMHDAQGNPSSNYAYFDFVRNPTYGGYTVRPGQIAELTGVQINEDGLFSYDLGYGGEYEYIRFSPVCNESVADSKTPPHVKIYTTGIRPVWAESLLVEFDLTKYGTYGSGELKTVKQYFYYLPKRSESASYTMRMEIILPNAVGINVAVAAGGYTAMSTNGGSLGGYNGTYVGSDGISARRIMKRSYELPYAVNDNILDNWYWGGGNTGNTYGLFPINRRGSGSYSGAVYTIDRWRGSLIVITALNSNGYLAIANSSGSSAGNFYQILEQKYNDLIDKTLTGSVLLSDGTLLSGSLTIPSGDSSSDYSFHDFTSDANIRPRIIVVNASTVWFAIRLAAGVTANIVAVKLEYGDTQTLAHEEFRTPNYVNVLNEFPNYDEQLLRCKISTADSTDPYANNRIDYGDMVAIVQTTNTATRAISSGQFVLWKGSLYTASSAIASGATLSSSNLTAVSGGVANGLNSIKVAKSGDTMTGDLKMKGAYQDTVAPTSETSVPRLRFIDKNETVVGSVSMHFTTGGAQRLLFNAFRNAVQHWFTVGYNTNGDPSVASNHPEAWRKMLGIGDSDGALPLTLAQGGTGGTTAAAARANLELGTVVEAFSIPANGTKAFTLTGTEIGNITVGGNVASGGREFIVYYCNGSGIVTYDKAFNASSINVTKSSYSITLENTSSLAFMGFRQYYT